MDNNEKFPANFFLLNILDVLPNLFQIKRHHRLTEVAVKKLPFSNSIFVRSFAINVEKTSIVFVILLFFDNLLGENDVFEGLKIESMIKENWLFAKNDPCSKDLIFESMN